MVVLLRSVARELAQWFESNPVQTFLGQCDQHVAGVMVAGCVVTLGVPASYPGADVFIMVETTASDVEVKSAWCRLCPLPPMRHRSWCSRAARWFIRRL